MLVTFSPIFLSPTKTYFCFTSGKLSFPSVGRVILVPTYFPDKVSMTDKPKLDGGPQQHGAHQHHQQQQQQQPHDPMAHHQQL